MNDTSENNQCPLCGAAATIKIFAVKDHSVSQEKFTLFQCTNCMLRFTYPVPPSDAIGKYYQSENYISHTDSSRGIINRIYRMVRNFSLKQKRTLVEKSTGVKNGNLLDVGSGTGYFTATMKHAGWQVTGLEPDAGARKISLQRHNIELMPVENLFQLPAHHFDAVTLWHVLEHVHDVKKYISTFKELLKKNGKLIIAVPNYTSYDAEVYKEHWAAYDVPRHLYHFAPATIEWLVKDMGLKIDSMKPMWFDSFYVSLLSSKYKKGSTDWVGAIWNAMHSNLKAMWDVKKCSSVIYIISGN